MTDPTHNPDAPAPVPGEAPEPTAWAASPDSQPWPASPSVPPPAPVLVPVRRSGGFGGGRVPGALVLVLAPVLAVVMFAGGVLAERSGALGTASLPVSTSAPTASGERTTADIEVVDEAWRTIHDHYVDPDSLDDQEMAYGAIRGMTEAVGDEGHTSFMTAEEAKASEQSLSGSFVGIGVQVTEDEDSRIQVSTVFPGTPAEEAGLKRGDHIVAVDGKTTEGETVDQSVARVRGPEGETVTLTIERAGTADFDVTITRRKYNLPLISWAMVPGTDIAMIRLEQFATGATDALKQAITDAKAKGATSVVLDMRSNPGGYVNEAIGVASQFVGDGIVYQSFDRSGERKDGKVEPGGLATDIPVVVLANGETASSAEIVTGAIQDAKRGQVVGEKTFGTGTVLGRFDLSDGSSMRIGVERWLTRGGRAIWREGLDPDVKVVLADDAQPLIPDALREMSTSEYASSTDLQVKKAVDLLTSGG
ncbi:MAG TPA: S41 family peptidase [Candidatus Limnocylindrales bacterium]|nr:S41 family peptidase [Candidatus Limnocylindrales bacterium]